MPPILLVMAGGAIGAGCRYGVGRAAGAAFPASLWPWGTFCVNLIGGFLMGLLAATLARMAAAEGWRLLLGVGVLGGFTTFSAFSLETVLMLQRGQVMLATGYVLASVLGAIAALWIGLQCAPVPA